MSDLDQLRRNARVTELLDGAFNAHQRGDTETAQRFIDEAAECDAAAVSVITGGMRIGEVPNPEDDPSGWIEYAGRIHGELARALEDARPPCPSCGARGNRANYPGPLPDGGGHWLCPACGTGWHAQDQEDGDG